MRNRTKLVALLLASASTIGIAQTANAQSNSVNLQLASASTQMATPEFVSVTAADSQSGGDAGGTATGNVGTIDVQGAGTTLGNGYIVPEDGPKERSTVTHQGIENMIPTANPYQIISILPGVNQFQDDPLGLSGGTIRVRGLTAAEMGFTVNGAPINDSGNFAVYPNELIDAENVEQMWVTQGSTDIDAPHVGASGGNIGVVTRAPLDYFNVRAEETAGQDSLLREFVSLDTGWVGDFKGFGSVSFTDADKWRGDGSDRRWHSDGSLLYQFLPHSSIGLIWAYNNGLNDEYRSYGGAYEYYPGDYEVGSSGHTALQTFEEIGRKADYDTFWGSGANYPINLYGPYEKTTPTCNTGPTSNTPICLVANPDFPQTQTTNVTNYWKLNLNPFKNALVTAPLHVQLTDDLRWETNGYVWYGDGGAGFGTTEQEGYSIVDGWTVGTAYGNAPGSQNEILLYEYEHTLTWRPGVTSKLVYDYDNFTFMGGIWYEHASQKQNEPFSIVNADGSPCNNAPNTISSCNLIGTSAYGTGPVEGYNDKVDSVGQAAYIESTGRFMDDALKITFGLSLRNIDRSDHTYQPVCADSPSLAYQPGYTSGATHTCAAVATTAAFLDSSAYNFFGGPTIGAAAAYAAMQRYAVNPHVSYTRMLPELNLTYDLDPFQQIFADVATGYRTPSTNNLWTFNSAGTVMESTDVKPEFDTTWESGYRYHGDFLTASLNAYLQDITNYQATVYIDEYDDVSTNIGGVKIFGLDGEVGTKPWHGFTFYGSGELQKSELGSDIEGGYCGQSGVSCPGGAAGAIVYVPTKGKQLVDTPDWIVSASVGYSQDGFFGAVTPHCYGQRATALANDEFVPANCVVDATVGYRFADGWGVLRNATLQLFALNLFDSSYLGQITTTGDTNAKTINNAYVGGTGTPATITGGDSSTTNYAAKPGSPLYIGVRLNANLN
ncbi:MAG TPA: TonB-dependent receptor [Rhizomicrobium sp.]|nr:TonB-dependent receptor [Rhizomicrobium sp.]